MAYSTKDITNRSRRLKAARMERKTELEEKQNKLKELLLKNRDKNREGSNLEGHRLDKSGNAVKIW